MSRRAAPAEGRKVVRLSITTWVGYSLGASHYYGDMLPMWMLRGSVNLSRKLSAKAAQHMNKTDEVHRRNTGFRWRPGMETQRFDSEDGVIAEALRTWRELFPDADVLLLDKEGVTSTSRVLDTRDPELMQELRTLLAHQGRWGPTGDWYEKWHAALNPAPMR